MASLAVSDRCLASASAASVCLRALMSLKAQHLLAFVASRRIAQVKMPSGVGFHLLRTAFLATVEPPFQPAVTPVTALIPSAQPLLGEAILQHDLGIVAAQHAERDRGGLDHRAGEAFVLHQGIETVLRRADQATVDAPAHGPDQHRAAQQESQRAEQARPERHQQVGEVEVVDQRPVGTAQVLEQRQMAGNQPGPAEGEVVSDPEVAELQAELRRHGATEDRPVIAVQQQEASGLGNTERGGEIGTEQFQPQPAVVAFAGHTGEQVLPGLRVGRIGEPTHLLFLLRSTGLAQRFQNRRRHHGIERRRAVQARDGPLRAWRDIDQVQPLGFHLRQIAAGQCQAPVRARFAQRNEHLLVRCHRHVQLAPLDHGLASLPGHAPADVLQQRLALTEVVLGLVHGCIHLPAQLRDLGIEARREEQAEGEEQAGDHHPGQQTKELSGRLRGGKGRILRTKELLEFHGRQPGEKRATRTSDKSKKCGNAAWHPTFRIQAYA